MYNAIDCGILKSTSICCQEKEKKEFLFNKIEKMSNMLKVISLLSYVIQFASEFFANSNHKHSQA